MFPPKTPDEMRGLGAGDGRAMGVCGVGRERVTNAPKGKPGPLFPNHVTELTVNTFLRLKTNSVPSGTDTTEAPSTENKPCLLYTSDAADES